MKGLALLPLLLNLALSENTVVKLDVYDQLWANNVDIAEKTLDLPFLQRMQTGNLSADDYVTFTIQDVYYLINVTAMLGKISAKVKEGAIGAFLKGRYDSYQSFAQYMLQELHLSGVTEIQPIPVMEKYLADYKTVMENEEPIYFAVALLPCSRLWGWLADRLEETTSNAYYTWKTSNMGHDPAKHYRVLLNTHLTTKDQIVKANDIFRQQMKNERDFFAASLLEKSNNSQQGHTEL